MSYSLVSIRRLPRFALAFLLCLVLSTARATPDHEIKTTEKFFGANADGCAILRTVDDNLGSYYHGNTKLYLDEYARGALAESPEPLGKRLRSTLLLDTDSHVDPDAPNWKASNVTKEVKSKDASISLAELLQKYSDSGAQWSDENYRKLTVDKTTGLVSLGRVTVLSQTMVKVLFPDRYPEEDLSLQEVIEAAGCLYLKVSLDSGGDGKDTRIVCLSPQRTTQINTRLTLQPFYLIAGSYFTLETAREKALALKKKCADAHVYSFHPQIWSYPGTPSEKYLIVDADTNQHIMDNQVPKLKEALGVDLVPQPSADFIEYFPIKD